jgi:hypothetical protein
MINKSMNIFSVTDSDILILDQFCEKCGEYRYEIISSEGFIPLIKRPILKNLHVVIHTKLTGSCMGCHDRKDFDLINQNVQIIPLPNINGLSIKPDK